MMKQNKYFLIMILFFLGLQTHAGILWVGGEDIDFQGGAQVCNQTGGGYYRSAYSRTALHSCTGGEVIATKPFQAGPVTTVWISGRVTPYDNCGDGGVGRIIYFGSGKSGTGYGLYVGNSGSASSASLRSKLSLYSGNSTIFTLLASEPGNSISMNTNNKIDMQIMNYGVVSTVNIYINGSLTPKLTFTGDVTVGGNVSLDDVRLVGRSHWCNGSSSISELIAADTDTRALSVVTMAPSASGTINNWAGGFANINPVAINDDSTITSTTPGEVFQTEVSNLPANSVSIQAVKVAARSFSNGGSPSSLSLGVFTNGVASEPAAVALSPAWDTKETYFHANPVTTMPWLPTEINLLQLNLKSAP